MESVQRTAIALVGAIAFLIAPAAAAIRSSTSAPVLTGDPAGLQLVRQVNRSYAKVPAVRSVVTAEGELLGRFTLLLRDGVTVAEQALVNEGVPPLALLVRREKEGTFVRTDRSCWLFLPAGDPQALTDVGKPILPGDGRVSKPRIAGDTITMTLTRLGHTAQVVVDRKTFRLRRLEAPGYLARFTSLATRPTLPVTKPRC